MFNSADVKGNIERIEGHSVRHSDNGEKHYRLFKIILLKGLHMCDRILK